MEWARIGLGHGLSVTSSCTGAATALYCQVTGQNGGERYRTVQLHRPCSVRLQDRTEWFHLGIVHIVPCQRVESVVECGTEAPHVLGLLLVEAVGVGI